MRAPVYREGYALVLSAGLASLLGFAFWIVAAHTYDTYEVGLNSAAISMMMLISATAQLNLVGFLVRFLPGARRSTRRFVGRSYAISLSASAVVTVVFLVVVDSSNLKLAFLGSQRSQLLFVAATMVWSIFSLQDAVLIGLRRAIWVPVDNTLFGIIKIGLLAAFAAVLPNSGILASWTLGAVFAVVVINAVLLTRLIPTHAALPAPPPDEVTLRVVGRFVAADYIGGLSWIAAITLIPIVITQRLGATENAYYSLAWVMIMPLYLVSASTANSLVVSLVGEPGRAGLYASRVAIQTARLILPGALGLALAAPLVLSVFGEDYREHSTTALRLLALSVIPNMVSTLYTGVWRAEKRLSLLVWVRCIQNGAVFVLSLALLEPYGIVGPAIAWLLVQIVVAAAMMITSPRVLAGGRSGPRRRLLHGILVVRNAAAASGVLTLSRGLKRWPRSRRRREYAASMVPRILADLPQNGIGPPPCAWMIHELPSSVTDKTVVIVGPPGGPPGAAIKLAASAGAARALLHETEVLIALGSDPRIVSLQHLLPKILAAGELDGRRFAVESMLSGIRASRLMDGRSSAAGLLGRLAQPIKHLHQATRTELEVGVDVLESWVDEPLAVLDAHGRREGGVERWQQRALEKIRAELHEVFLGRTITASWIHGDYSPGNVILDPATGAVCGIVDWELAASTGPPEVDLVQLVLSSRALQRRREFGEIVTGAVAGNWTAEEKATLSSAWDALNGRDEPMRELVLLAWLRHTSSILTKSAGYAHNWLWTKANLEVALAVLA